MNQTIDTQETIFRCLICGEQIVDEPIILYGIGKLKITENPEEIKLINLKAFHRLCL